MKCSTEKFSLGKILVEKNAFNTSPPYQREGGVWSLERKQLFMDSLLNGFDIPKVYLHELDEDKRHNYSIIDGKQRFNCIWDFLDNKFELSSGFKVLKLKKGEKTPPDFSNCTFKSLSEPWQEELKARTIDIVIVRDANEQDIEELFSRLNNGEPLNSAEKRNAFGGDMCDLIRDVAEHEFFKSFASFKKERYVAYEVATKILLFEDSSENGSDWFIDTKKKNLDGLVLNNKKIDESRLKKLRVKTNSGLNSLKRLFSKNDPLLKRQTYVPMYYLFSKFIISDYGSPDLISRLKSFLEYFQKLRQENLDKPEDQRENDLTEFGRLIQQGTNDATSLRTRVSLLKRYFFQENPDVEIKDRKRSLRDEERYVVWLRADKKCSKCKKPLPTLEDMQSDHITQWAHGGPTTISNARCLCKSCNLEVARKQK